MPEEKHEPLSADIIRAGLQEGLRDREIYVFDTIDSTNTRARELAAAGAAHGTLLLAGEQTAGRGRHGKSFASPAGAGLYMSLVLRQEKLFCDTQLLTVAAAVAVCRALEATAAVEPRIKWVNDVYLNGKKLCGILCENAAECGALIAGIGINLDFDALPPELDGIAGALDAAVSRNVLAAAVVKELEKVLSLKKAEMLAEYTDRSFMAGKNVSFALNGERLEGTALGIGENGDLLVRLDSGKTLSLNSGEVSVKGTGEWM